MNPEPRGPYTIATTTRPVSFLFQAIPLVNEWIGPLFKMVDPTSEPETNGDSSPSSELPKKRLYDDEEVVIENK